MKKFVIRKPLSVMLLSLMSATGAVQADSQTAYVAARHGDYATAFSEWQLLAEEGDADSQYNLGVMFEQGLGKLKTVVEG